MALIYKDLTFSDGMEDVIIFVREIETDKVKRYSLPFKIGRTMAKGHFMRNFIDMAARRALLLFYPREFHEVLHILNAATLICAAASELEKSADIIGIANKLINDLEMCPAEEPKGKVGEAYTLYNSIKMNLYLFGREEEDKVEPRKKEGAKEQDVLDGAEIENDEDEGAEESEDDEFTVEI